MENAKITASEKNEILKRTEGAHVGLAKIVMRLDPDLWTRKPDPDSWSASENLEHVLLAERSLMRRVREHQNDAPDPSWMVEIAGKEEKLRRILPYLGKAKAGPNLSTFKGLEQNKAVSELQLSYEGLAVLLDQTADLPLKAVLLPHGFFGTLSAFLLLLYLPLHTKRHLRQIREHLGIDLRSEGNASPSSSGHET